MARFWKIVRNKYIFSSFFAVTYMLVLHDTDIFTLLKRQQKVSELELEAERKRQGIIDLKSDIAELKNIRSLEKYARETHLFKKEDEDLYIFSFE